MSDEIEGLKARLARAIELKTGAELQVGHFIHRVAVLESALRRALAAGDSLASHAEEASAMYGVSCEGVVPNWEDESRPGYEALTPATKPETAEGTENGLHLLRPGPLPEPELPSMPSAADGTDRGREGQPRPTSEILPQETDPAQRRQEVTLYRAECGCPVDEHDVECPSRAPARQEVSEPTHRCKVCGALWWLGDVTPVGMSWSLRSPTCGKCCDNVTMGDQIEPLSKSPEPAKCEHDFTVGHYCDKYGVLLAVTCNGPKPEAQRTGPRRQACIHNYKLPDDQLECSFCEMKELKAQLAEANARIKELERALTHGLDTPDVKLQKAFEGGPAFLELLKDCSADLQRKLMEVRSDGIAALQTANEYALQLAKDWQAKRDAERKAKEDAQAELHDTQFDLARYMERREGLWLAKTFAENERDRARELQAQAERDLIEVVKKSAEKSFAGYRELAARAEQAERERDDMWKSLGESTEHLAKCVVERDLAQSQVAQLQAQLEEAKAQNLANQAECEKHSMFWKNRADADRLGRIEAETQRDEAVRLLRVVEEWWNGSRLRCPIQETEAFLASLEPKEKP